MWYVYLLKGSQDGMLYVGSANDLRRRLGKHKKGQSRATKHREDFDMEATIAVKQGLTALRPRSLSAPEPGVPPPPTAARPRKLNLVARVNLLVLCNGSP